MVLSVDYSLEDCTFIYQYVYLSVDYSVEDCMFSCPQMSLSERLTVMMSAPYLVKLVKQMLPQAPQERHVPRLLCLCQFTEECACR